MDNAVALLGFGSTLIGMFISYAFYQTAMDKLREAILIAKKINAIYRQGQVTKDVFFTSIEQLMEEYKKLGGVIGEFSNENINNEFGDLGTKLKAMTYLSIGIGGISIIISAISFVANHIDKSTRIILAGLSFGLSLYSLCKSIVNKLTIPGLPSTLSEIGLVLNGISVGAGAYGVVRELAS